MTSFTHCEYARGDLPPAARDELLVLARTMSAADLDEAALLARIARYQEAHLGYEHGALVAAMLVDRVPTAHGTLVYLGPAFSRGGAYVRLFGALVTRALATEGAFAFAMEVENASVAHTLAEILPGQSYPRACETPAPVTACAAAMLACVDHVHDFDARSMTSAIDCPMRRGAFPARYRVFFVPCDGTLPERETLARDLGRGLARHAARVARVKERRALRASTSARAA